MPLALPAADPIDETRAGVLSVSPELVGEVLRLPVGNRVRAARIGSDGSIELMIEGADMPPRIADAEPERVMVIANIETREETGERRSIAYWRHAPGKRWILRGWE